MSKRSDSHITQIKKLEQQRRKAWATAYSYQERIFNMMRQHQRDLRKLDKLLTKSGDSDDNDRDDRINQFAKKLLLQQKELLTCPVCHEDHKDVDNITLTKCTHIFCKDCLKTWLEEKESCPLCREKLIWRDNTNRGEEQTL